MHTRAPTDTLRWSSSDCSRHFASLSLVYSIICRSTAEHTQKPTIKSRSVFSVRAGSEPALQTNSLSQPHVRCTTTNAALRAILDSQLQRKSAMRSKQLPHLLHLGHTPTMKQAKGNRLPHNKPTSAARKQHNVQLLVSIHSTELNRSALNWADWADSVSSCNSASATARETARRISIEQRFRSMAGKHATALAFICMLLIVTLSLVYSFYLYHAVPSATIYSYLNEFHTYASNYVPPSSRQLPDSTQGVGHAATKVASRQGEAPHLAAQQQLLELHNAHWDLVAEASSQLAITRNTQRLPHGELALLQLTQLFYTQHQ